MYSLLDPGTEEERWPMIRSDLLPRKEALIAYASGGSREGLRDLKHLELVLLQLNTAGAAIDVLSSHTHGVFLGSPM